MTTLIDGFRSFEISRDYGFVPDRPSQALGPAFGAWESVAAALPQHLTKGTLQTSICNLPSFEVSRLDQPGQWQRAYIILAFLTHGWVHGCVRNTVPPILAEPLLHVCHHMGMKPVLSYAGLCLYNWVEGSGEGTLCGHQAAITFTGTFDEAVFYLVPVLVEKEGGILVSRLLEAQETASKHEWGHVLAILDITLGRLKAMGKSLEELKAVNPDNFYHQIRPYVAGLNVTLERDIEEDVKINLVGGSAGQSSLFQVLDYLLGVRHVSGLPSDMRPYMPGAHRQFLDELEKLPSIGELLKPCDVDSVIQNRLQECLSELRNWRRKHIAIVTRYIMLPAQAEARRNGTQGSVLGTAGSSPVAFLKEMRNDTQSTFVA